MINIGVWSCYHVMDEWGDVHQMHLNGQYYFLMN